MASIVCSLYTSFALLLHQRLTHRGRMSSSTLIDSERTPLIPKSQSQVVISCTDQNGDGDQESIDDGKGGREVEVYKPGKSSFTQTVRTFSNLDPFSGLRNAEGVRR